jgi:hypothetical protein
VGELIATWRGVAPRTAAEGSQPSRSEATA